MAASSGAGQVFRFLDLPPEIRDQVYEHSLCSFRDHEYPDEDSYVPGPVVWVDKSRITSSLLRVSRQVYDEARAVVVRKNLFVQVECRMSPEKAQPIQLLVLELGLPLVDVDSRCSLVKKRIESTRIGEYRPLLAMTYVMSSRKTSPDYWPDTTLRFMILLRELDDLLIELASADEAEMIDCRTAMTHQVIIHTHDDTKKKNGVDREFLAGRAVLERLLAPFSKHYQGFKGLTIKTNSPRGEASSSGSSSNNSNLDAELVASTISAVKCKPQNTVPEILAQARVLKDQGAAFFKAGKTRVASKQWTRAANLIVQARQEPDFAARYVSKPKDSVERLSLREMAEVSFLLHLNLAQHALRVVQKADDDEDSWCLERASTAVFRYLRRAGLECSLSDETGLVEPARDVEDDGDTTGGWRPTDAQMAKLFYRFAKNHRFREEWDEGCMAIGFAKRYAPADAAVRAEEAMIVELSGEVLQAEMDEFMYSEAMAAAGVPGAGGVHMHGGVHMRGHHHMHEHHHMHGHDVYDDEYGGDPFAHETDAEFRARFIYEMGL